MTNLLNSDSAVDKGRRIVFVSFEFWNCSNEMNIGLIKQQCETGMVAALAGVDHRWHTRAGDRMDIS